MKHYLVYKTINKIDGKFYIGAHQTNNINDTYLGSGIYLQRAIRKYGKENFERIILKECQSADQMYDEEEKVIHLHLGDSLCYNMKRGGRGGWNFVNENKINCGDNNVMRKDPIAKRKMVNSWRRTRNANKERFDAISKENLKFAIKKNLGRKRPEHAEFMREWIKRNGSNLRPRQSNQYQVLSPEGEKFVVSNIVDFCRMRGLAYVTMYNSAKTGKAPKVGRNKGWSCKKI